MAQVFELAAELAFKIQSSSFLGRIVFETKQFGYVQQPEDQRLLIDVWHRNELLIKEEDRHHEVFTPRAPLEWEVLYHYRQSNGHYTVFERKFWTDDTIVIDYDAATGTRTTLLTATEASSAVGAEFVVDFIDDEHMLVLQKDRLFLGKLKPGKVEIIVERPVISTDIRPLQSSWQEDELIVVWCSEARSLVIQSLPIRKPRPLLQIAHNSALLSNRKFELPLVDPVRPLFGSNSYRR